MSDDKNVKDPKEAIRQLAQDRNMPVCTTSNLADELVGDVLRSMFRRPRNTEYDEVSRRLVSKPLTSYELELNNKIKNLWKKLYHHEFPEAIRNKTRPRGVFGPPGEGKSTAPEMACRFVAKELGMDFVNSKDLPYVPYNAINENTFIFQNLQTAGAQSAMEVIGLPAKGQFENSEQTYLDRLLPQWAYKMLKAGGSYLMLDDALNANLNVQDGLMELLNTASLNSFSFHNTLLGVTGNLGAADGTNANKASTAFLGRIASCIALDDPESFISRMRREKRFADEVGDAFVTSFLRKYPEKLSVSLDELSDISGPYASSRTWYDTTEELRDCLFRAGGRTNLINCRDEFIGIVERGVGMKHAKDFNAFIEAVLSKADPLASAVIMSKQKMNYEGLREEYFKILPPDVRERAKNGQLVQGHRSEDLQFAYAFADSLVAYTVNRVRTEDSLECLERFGLGCTILPQQQFEYAISSFLNVLNDNVYTVEGGKFEVSTEVKNDKKLTSRRRVLTPEAYTRIGDHIVDGYTGMTEDLRDFMCSVLSGMQNHNKVNNDMAVKAGVTRSTRKKNP